MKPFVIPTLNGSNSVKELTVKVLGEEWPLNAKNIYSKVRHLSPKPVTYQAVHKALHELETGEIVKRQGNSYGINVDWLGRIETYAHDLKNNYEKRNGDQIVRKGHHTFKTIAESEEFLIELLHMDALKNPQKENPPVCTQWAHFWVPLFLNHKTYLMIKELAPLLNVYSVTHANTWLDRWCQSFWTKHYHRTKLGIKQAANNIDIAVQNDKVIQIYIPQDLRQPIETFYEKTKRFNQLDLDKFFDGVFLQKSNIYMTISENPELAEQIRTETMSWFKGKK